jgi:Protein of unknown function (DUF2934)
MNAKPVNPTAESLRKQIEARAYLLWERDGRPYGRHEEHWAQAEKEILGERKDKAPPRKKAKATSSPKPSTKRRGKSKKK